MLREELFSSYTKILKMLKLISTRTRIVSKSIELNVIVSAVYGNTVGRLSVLRYRILLISYHRYLCKNVGAPLLHTLVQAFQCILKLYYNKCVYLTKFKVALNPFRQG